MTKISELCRQASGTPALALEGQPGIKREILEKLFPIEVDMHKKLSPMAEKACKVQSPPEGEKKALEDIFPEEVKLNRSGVEENGAVPDGGGPAPAVPEESAGQKDLLDGIRIREQALTGDREAADRAVEFFERTLRECPDSPLITAYYADCLSLKGLYSRDPAEMFACTRKAMTVFDSAVNASPGDAAIRLMRARHCFRSPEAFFRRTATAINDFQHLARRFEQDPSIFPREIYWQVLYGLGEAYSRSGEKEKAQAAWSKLLEESCDPVTKTS